MEAKYVLFSMELDWWLEGVEFNGERFDMNDDSEALDKFREKWPMLVNDKDELQLIIDVENGHIENWPEGKTASFLTVKIVDCGHYELLDAERNIIKQLDGYVPDFLSIEDEGYGDYLEFEVREDGCIDKWKFGQKELDEINEEWE